MNKTGIFLTIVIICAMGIILYGMVAKDQILKGGPSTLSTQSGSSSKGETESPAIAAVKADIVHEASLDSTGEVSVISAYRKQWPDGCLGLGKDELCTESVVPGYEITLLAGGKNYTYRTNEDGSLLRQVK